jgi:hypothetical protein
LLVTLLAALIAPACSLGEGQGQVTGTLNISDCWTGPFDLKPDFFAAVPGNPIKHALTIRVQSGGDYETFSDGLSVLVDDVNPVRTGQLNQDLMVALPPEVTPPGVPVKANPNPARVHATLYLGRSCRTQNLALYALDQVTGVGADGECGPVPGDPLAACTGTGVVPDGGVPEAGVDAGNAIDASVPSGSVGKSTIRFSRLFDADPDQSDASERLTDASFDFYLGDPREICPGGIGPPPPCRGHVKGYFRFYFQRGRPAQPFP